MMDSVYGFISNIWLNYKYQLLFSAETFLKVFIFINGIMALTALLTLGERKISALMQDRVGPNRASIFGFAFWGLFHPIADGIKLLTKEDFVGDRVNKFLFTIAPIIGMTAILTCFAFIPFGNYIDLFGYKIKLQIVDIDSSIFLLLAISSMAIYSPFLGGYSSANNFAILGAIRAAAQMISYEIVIGISLIPMIMIYSSGSLQDIALKQGDLFMGLIPKWGIFLQPLSFLIFLTAATAENKRTPFDVVEGESEIIGFFIEYSSMRFAAFMFTEYVELVLISMIAITFFFGGWQVPFVNEAGISILNLAIPLNHILISLMQMAIFAFKVAVFSALLLTIRWTLPRFRFDQIMSFCWQFLLPIALFNVLLTALFLMR